MSTLRYWVRDNRMGWFHRGVCKREEGHFHVSYDDGDEMADVVQALLVGFGG